MIEAKLQQVLATFRQAKELEEAGVEYLTFTALIDAGKKLEPYPEALRTKQHLVTKCTSTVHLAGECREGAMVYVADFDSAFVKGELGILLEIFNGQTPALIAGDKTKRLFIDFFDGLQACVSISMNRTQGFFGMFDQIRKIARGQLSTTPSTDSAAPPAL